ncbi:MAG: PAS domain-containing protein [Deltaproteobacteria bacterium]|nr:PAS domain-containing protein [Deltaproteobacteria bacterium]
MKRFLNYPLSTFFVLVAVMLTGAVFLMSTHAYFHHLEAELGKKAANERSRHLIGEQIVNSLQQIKSRFYQMLPEAHQGNRKTIHGLIGKDLAEIRTGVQVIENGGFFHKKLPRSSAEKEELQLEITYTRTGSSQPALNTQAINSLLPEIEEKFATLENLLLRRDELVQQAAQGKGNLMQIREELFHFIKNTEPLFGKMSEEGNGICLAGTKRLEEIEKEGQTLIKKYQLAEFSIIIVILAITFSLCFALARKILAINAQLQNEILEKKRAEESISRAKQEWERTFDAVPDPIVLLDSAHRIIRLNKAMASLVGKPVEQCIGLKCYKVMHETESPPSYCPHTLLLNDQREHKTVQFLDLFGVFFEVSVSPLFDQSGKLVGSVHIARDITDQKQAENSLQKANEELEQKVEQRTIVLKRFIDELQHEISNRIKAEEALFQTQHQLLHAEKLSAIGKLTASIAHEFNNPLFAIANILLGVQQQESFSEQNMRMLELAIQECDRMKNLIQNLRDFNRPTSGALVHTNIHQTIDNILLLCKKEFNDRKITVEKDFAEHMPDVLVVKDQICQVLLNLLTNARDACGKGGHVKIKTELHGKNIAIIVQDSGLGIEPENMHKIFKPFFTTKQELSGTGLGLAVSLGIIEKHGGTISVGSQPKVGSIFTVTLPIMPEDIQPYPAHQQMLI